MIVFSVVEYLNNIGMFDRKPLLQLEPVLFNQVVLLFEYDLLQSSKQSELSSLLHSDHIEFTVYVSGYDLHNLEL